MPRLAVELARIDREIEHLRRRPRVEMAYISASRAAVDALEARPKTEDLSFVFPDEYIGSFVVEFQESREDRMELRRERRCEIARWRRSQPDIRIALGRTR